MTTGRTRAGFGAQCDDCGASANLVVDSLIEGMALAAGSGWSFVGKTRGRAAHDRCPRCARKAAAAPPAARPRRR